MVLSGQFLFDRDFDSTDPEEERRRRERELAERRERARYLGRSGADDDPDNQPAGEDDASAEEHGPPLAYTEEAFNKAVADAEQKGYRDGQKAGYKKGKKEGQQEAKEAAEQKQAQQLQKALDQIAKHLPQLLDEQRDMLAQIPDDAARVGVALARTMMPQLERQYGLDEIEAVLRQRLAELIDEPRLLVKVSPEMRPEVAQRLHQLAQETGYDGKLAVLGEDGLGPSDVKISWSNGGAERVMERLWYDGEAIVQRVCGDGPSSFAEGAPAERPPEPETPEPEPAQPEPAAPEAGEPAAGEPAPQDGEPEPGAAESESPQPGDGAPEAHAEPAGDAAEGDAADEPETPREEAPADPAEAEAAETATAEAETGDPEAPEAAAAAEASAESAAGAVSPPGDDGFEQGAIVDENQPSQEAQANRRPSQKREMGNVIADFDAPDTGLKKPGGNPGDDQGGASGNGLDQALQEFGTKDDAG